MKHTAFATLRDGTIVRIDAVEANGRQDAAAQVFAKFPPCTIESVCAWPIGEAKVTLDALSLRISPNPTFDSAFGCLV